MEACNRRYFYTKHLPQRGEPTAIPFLRFSNEEIIEYLTVLHPTLPPKVFCFLLFLLVNLAVCVSYVPPMTTMVDFNHSGWNYTIYKRPHVRLDRPS